ncbi:HEAT repeat domain-containing protein [Amycolatopsis mediterranei]|uniref:HEAT repeat domain-containing protein n=1 Tax=Amycolatopsis mediterranei TaxID=33910 RepID=UPI00341B9EA5
MEQGDTGLVGWLVRRAGEEDDWSPRSRAIWLAVIVGGHQPEILAWVRDLASGDEDPMVRSVAVELWALSWVWQPGERAALARAGSGDLRPDVRTAVTQALADTRPSDPEISRWLGERTRDSDERVGPWCGADARRPRPGLGDCPRLHRVPWLLG